MKDKYTVKFIYFDVGGVLLKWRESLGHLARHHRVDPDAMQAIFKQYDLHFSRGGFSEEEVWSVFTTLLRLPEKEQFNFNTFCVQYFTPLTHTHELLKKLARTYSIGLLTNVYPGTFEIIQKSGLIPQINYEQIIQSCEVGYAKPDIEIYELAQRRAGVAHEEILFVDDLVINLDAAASLGWQTSLFDEHTPYVSSARVLQVLEG